MNPFQKLTFITGVASGLVASAVGQPADSAATNSAAAVTERTATNSAEKIVIETPALTNATALNVDIPAPEATTEPELEPTTPVPLTPPSTNTISYGDKGLRLNFRGVPLEMVLNYLSDAAGFIIVLETDVKGTIDAWSNQPLDKKEAVSLLNSVLNKNGYAILQNDRTLTVVSRDEAKRRDVPIKSGNNPSSIPKNSDVVTQIISVGSLSAVQLVKDLAPLLPADTTLSANESGNALLMTDTQTNIRRIAEIVRALDTAGSSVNSIRVYPLQFADSKALVTVIKELFPSANSSQGNNNGGGGRMGRMAAMFGGGPGGFPGGDGGGGGSEGRSASARVLAVADETSNSLIVGAPEDLLPTIEQLVKSIDVSVEDVTELRVFKLNYSDPEEMANLLSELFPNDTTTSGGQQQQRFGMFAGFGGPRQATASSSQSDRLKKKGRVLAVPDQRTASVVVSADKSMMLQIATMVEQLDSNPAKKQKVFVYTLQNADIQDVEPVLQNLFQGNNSRNSYNSSSSQNNALTTRNQQMQQSSGSTINTSTSRSRTGTR